jgi:hypothetical protein
MEFLYLPLTLYVFFIGSIKTGKLFYFSAANPKIPLGGFANDSKFSIIKNIPVEFKPKTILITKTDNIDNLKHKFQDEDFSFPLFAKPDIGEGGFLARKINSWDELLNYHSKHRMDYLVQEFIDYPLEFSILIHNAECNFKISSITERKHLTIIGDGYSSIEELLSADKRAKFRIKNIKKQCESQLKIVLEKGKTLQPTSLGNWDYGAIYIERSELINKAKIDSLENVNKTINLFNYARYDIKCNSVEDFLQGKMKILEINGVKGEPIHIYDSKYNLYEAYKEIFKHWGFIMEISKRNIKEGIVCPNFIQGFDMLRKHYITKKTSLIKRNQYE